MERLVLGLLLQGLVLGLAMEAHLGAGRPVGMPMQEVPVKPEQHPHFVGHPRRCLYYLVRVTHIHTRSPPRSQVERKVQGQCTPRSISSAMMTASVRVPCKRV